jgi:hypothetical protein
MAINLNPTTLLGPDFYGFLLPWIFTFAIVYGLLMKAGPFKDNKSISGALAFVMAFFVTAVGGPQISSFFIGLFGGASMFLAGILVLILFLAMVDKNFGSMPNMAVVGAVVLIAAFLFLSSSENMFGIRITSDMSTLVFWGVVIVAAIYVVMHDSKTGGTPDKK